MATSGSVDFDLTRNEIINDALLHCGAIAAGENPPAEDTAFAARQLNRMVKSWHTSGVHLWTRREFYLFLQKSQARYKIGPNSTEHSAEIEDSVDTALAAAVVAGAGTITVDSVTGMTASNAVGVVLDSGSIEWDTIASIASPVITLTGTISAAAAIDNKVFTYTSKVARPLRILDVERRDRFDLDTPIAMISHREYQRLPNKTIIGKTNEVYYQPEHPDGFLYAWPEPETASDRLRLTGMFPIEDFDASADNADFPQEWLDALTWGLARRLCPSYSTPGETVALIHKEADDSFDAATNWDREPESTYFAPDMTGGG